MAGKGKEVAKTVTKAPISQQAAIYTKGSAAMHLKVERKPSDSRLNSKPAINVDAQSNAS